MIIILNVLLVLAGWVVMIPVLFGIILFVCYGLDQSYQENASKKVIWGFWILVLTAFLGVFVGFPVWVFS